MLTIKSDDVTGRNKTYEAIVKGYPIAEPGIPESFKVMIKEFQSLGLDLRILTEEKQEVSLSELATDDIETAPFTVKTKEPTQDIELNFDNKVAEGLIEENPENTADTEDKLLENFDEDSLFDDFE